VTAAFGPIDPEVAEALATGELAGAEAVPPRLANLARLRARAASLPPAQLPDVAATCEEVAVGSSTQVSIYAPDTTRGSLPCLFWIYGGGYIFAPTCPVDPRLLRWASEYECVIVAPTYRLAPEHPYPAAHDDCWAAVEWTVRSAERLGIDRGRVVMGGESAGGGLAAGIVLRARDEGDVQFQAQILVYAALDDRHVTPSSQVVDAPAWSSGLSRFAWDCYLGADRGDEVSPYAAPARAADLSGLPPTFIAVGANDITRDENLAFARRLQDVGTPTELQVYPGAPHAFELLAPDAAVSREFSRDLDDVVERSLHGRVASARRPAI
jgi:acetyl esterase/lipase